MNIRITFSKIKIQSKEKKKEAFKRIQQKVLEVLTGKSVQ